MKKEESLKSIGTNIQKARLKKGLTQAILAEKCNVSTKYISALERGISSGSVSLIVDICNILDITPNYIFNKCIYNCHSDSDIDIIDPETSIAFLKLNKENKDFIKTTINHLYAMQKKR